MSRLLRRLRNWLGHVSRALGKAGYLVAFLVPALATWVPAFLADRGAWWSSIGAVAGFLLLVFRGLRVRDIRARLASLEKAGDSVVNDLQNGLKDLQMAQRQGYQPTTMWSQAIEHIVKWQNDIDVYLRDTPELGSEYVDRFDRHPKVGGRSIKAIDRVEAAIPQVRERQRRLSEFREEIK